MGRLIDSLVRCLDQTFDLEQYRYPAGIGHPQLLRTIGGCMSLKIWRAIQAAALSYTPERTHLRCTNVFQSFADTKGL